MEPPVQLIEPLKTEFGFNTNKHIYKPPLIWQSPHDIDNVLLTMLFSLPFQNTCLVKKIYT